MVQVTICFFKTKNQERLRFVSALNKYGVEIGLGKSKELLDEMLSGKKIVISVLEKDISFFVEELKVCEIEFLVGS